jgi:HAD superfamily hydrolase (TIGR01450 family)
VEKTELFLHCDLEGTLWSSGRPFFDTLSFLDWLKTQPVCWNLLTNTVSRTPERLIRDFQKAGLSLEPQCLVTPFTTLDEFLISQFPGQFRSRANFYFIGSLTQVQRLARRPFPASVPEWVIFADWEHPGPRRRTLNTVLDFLLKGSRLAALSPSISYERGGRSFLDTGSFVRLFEPFLQSKPVFLGKPSASFLDASRRRFASRAFREVVLGDDVNTDLRMAKAAGIDSILIRRGKYRQGDEDRERPTWCATDLSEVREILKENYGLRSV